MKGCVSSDVAPTLAVTSDPCPSSRTVVTGDSEDSGAADLTSPIPGSSSFGKQHDAALMQDLLKGVSLQCPSCDRMSDVTLQPCGHKSVCQRCVATVTSCPVCDVHIDEKEVDNTGNTITQARACFILSQDLGRLPLNFLFSSKYVYRFLSSVSDDDISEEGNKQ